MTSEGNLADALAVRVGRAHFEDLVVDAHDEYLSNGTRSQAPIRSVRSSVTPAAKWGYEAIRYK